MLRKLNEARRTRKGFTLIELLVVVLILAILMAVALPLYLNAVADSQKKTCRANMQTIANAAQAYKVSSPGKTYGSLPITGAAIGTTYTDLLNTPVCPSNGTYTVQALGQGIEITCSTGGGPGPGATVGQHGTYRPGIDSQ